MNWYKIAQADIEYIGAFNLYGADFVQFRIGADFWAYRLGFPDWVTKAKQIAKYSAGKALAFAKKNKSEALKVTKDFPMPGSIIREE